MDTRFFGCLLKTSRYFLKFLRRFSRHSTEVPWRVQL